MKRFFNSLKKIWRALSGRRVAYETICVYGHHCLIYAVIQGPPGGLSTFGSNADYCSLCDRAVIRLTRMDGANRKHVERRRAT